MDSLAENFSLVLHEPQGYFQSGGSNAQKLVASVEGGLNATAKLGFPEPVSTSWWQGILNLANSLIDDFIDLVVSAWNAICNIIGGAVDFVLGLWNHIVGATLGAAIEAVKSVTNIIIEGFKAIVTSIINSPSSQNPFTNLSNEYINPQNAGNFLMNWQSFIPLDTISNDIASDYNQMKPITDTFTSLTNTVDLTKMIPDDLSVFQDLFKILSPTFVYEIFINLIIDILSQSITDVLLQAITTTFESDEAIMAIYNDIIVTFGDRISNSYPDLINFSPNNGNNLPLNQYSTPVLLINSIFADISDLFDSLTSIIGFDIVGNLVLDFGNKMFNLILGLFYPTGTIPGDSSLLLLSCIGEFIPSILSALGYKIWGNDFGANLEGKDIPQQAIAITKGLTELFIDFAGICYASATVYMLKEYDTRI